MKLVGVNGRAKPQAAGGARGLGFWGFSWRVAPQAAWGCARKMGWSVLSFRCMLSRKRLAVFVMVL